MVLYGLIIMDNNFNKNLENGPLGWGLGLGKVGHCDYASCNSYQMFDEYYPVSVKKPYMRDF